MSKIFGQDRFKTIMKSILIVCILFFNSTLFAQQNIDLFIWAGQSNALGRQGNAAEYPADINNLDNQIQFNWTVTNGSNSNGWTSMEPQDLGHYFPAGHFGPEVTFSRKLVLAGYSPAIFKFTQGATSIHDHWLNPGDGGLYDNMVAALNTAIIDLENLGHTVTIKGLIWIQGESDSNSQAAASAYLNNLTTLINDFRTNAVGNPILPIILGVDEQFFNIPGRERHQILNAHQDIALNDDNIKFTSMYGYPKADVTHLTPMGLISHGEEIFNSYELLISGQNPTSNCTVSSLGNHNSFERTSWGQSFTTDCSGILSNITFEAATQHSTSATFTLYNGADCSGTVLALKSLNTIEIGDNIIGMISEGLHLDKEHTYYFDIVSDNGTNWEIDFSDVDNVFGVLRCTSDDGTENCGRTFLDYDMDFSVVLNASESCDIFSPGSEVSFNRTSWGQTFATTCSGDINSITFSSASTLNTTSTFSLYDGNDCSADILYSKPLSAISIGNNLVTIENPLFLNENNTYYFQVTSDENSVWQIHYSNTDIVSGMLVCTSNDGTSDCGRTFPGFDMNFSAVVGGSTCSNITNIYSFEYNNNTYEVIKEAKNWMDAAACAVERGGALARIDDTAEQTAIWNELNIYAGIVLSNTVASNGGGASYVWIGGTDLLTEGIWNWDGTNNGSGDQFWLGDANGNSVGGLYSNWGNEPDNAGNQDGLAIALTQWPLGSGSLGTAGQWNDLIVEDPLYYLIEYPTILSGTRIVPAKLSLDQNYPNPFNPKTSISFFLPNAGMAELRIFDLAGRVIRTLLNEEQSAGFHEVSWMGRDDSGRSVASGTYFYRLTANDNTYSRKMLLLR